MIKGDQSFYADRQEAHTEIPCDTTQLNEWLRGTKVNSEVMPNVPAELREFDDRHHAGRME